MDAPHCLIRAQTAPSPPLLQRLRDCPRNPPAIARAIRVLWELLCRAWLRVYHRLSIVGRHNLPASGPFVIVANHASHLDALALLAALPLRRVHQAYPAAAEDYFFRSPLRAAFCALCLNAVPFPRCQHVHRGIAACRRILRAGDNVLILFPEGTRSADGSIGPFHRGVGDLVAARNIPVVPCHIEGAFEAMPRASRFPRPRKLTLRIGSPLSFAGLSPCKSDAIRIAHDLRAAVVNLNRCNHDHNPDTTRDRSPADMSPTHLQHPGRRRAVLSCLAAGNAHA
ncbi:lysophospholipid acyltransferase family protein [Fontivita pretiosa]|uniref:lysophospholipid acyltransferase family protein n=1 Tax=Fontivita pretiosa TaxID=2989684 RepID=UPI003D162E5A